MPGIRILANYEKDDLIFLNLFLGLYIISLNVEIWTFYIQLALHILLKGKFG